MSCVASQILTISAVEYDRYNCAGVDIQCVKTKVAQKNAACSKWMEPVGKKRTWGNIKTGDWVHVRDYKGLTCLATCSAGEGLSTCASNTR